MLKVGDLVETPRFLKVRISEVFDSVQEARKAGFVESTDYRGDFKILGKSIDLYHMVFAAVRV